MVAEFVHARVLGRLVVSDSVRLCGLQPSRLLCPWILQAPVLLRAAVSSSRGSSQARDHFCASCVSLGDLPEPGITSAPLVSPALAGRFMLLMNAFKFLIQS